jgi:hypothetical protein
MSYVDASERERVDNCLNKGKLFRPPIAIEIK